MALPMGPLAQLGGKSVELAAHAAEIGKVGAAFLKGAVQMAAHSISDETTQAMLGLPNSNPEHPVAAALAHAGASALMGGAAGSVFTLGEGLIGKGITSEAGAKAATKAQEFLVKLGTHENPAAMLGVSATAAAVPAYKTAESIEEKTGVPSWMTYGFIEGVYTLLGYKAVSAISPYITGAAVKALMENEASGVPNAVHVANHVGKGLKSISDAAQGLFSLQGAELAKPASEGAVNKLRDFIENGQVNSQILHSNMNAFEPKYAAGGEVKPEPTNHFAKVYPEQNLLFSAAKGRISNYLNSLRPQPHAAKAAFDDAPSTKEQERQYKKALELAVSPMTIMNHINKGNLTPEHVNHFKSMFPEVHTLLSKEITKKIITEK
jgi:hypothetical protein